MAIATDNEYELILMLDPEVPEERREEIAAATRKRIEDQANLKHDTSWGMRKLAYEIRQRTEADYRLFRFEGQGGVLDDLNHNLRIADGVLRFRIFKVDPRSPSLVPPAAMATAGAAPQRTPRRAEAPAQDAAAEAPAEGAQEAPAESAEEAPAEPAPEEGPSAPDAAAPAPAEAGTEAPAEGAEPEAPSESEDTPAS